MTDKPTLWAEDYRSQEEDVAGWKVTVISYRLGDRYHCVVENAGAGARLARGEGSSREEAQAQGLERARRRLSRTKTHDVD